MDANTPTGPVQSLLSRLVEIYSIADHSSCGSDYARQIDLSRDVAQDLRVLVGTQCSLCRGEIQSFLDCLERLTDLGRTPEDRELIGLMEWATRLHDLCTDQEHRGTCPASRI
jgi:hypothetical protein